MFNDLIVESVSNETHIHEAFGTVSLSEFNFMAEATDLAIKEATDSYRNLMTESLQESGGVPSEKTGVIAGAASDHIGKRILAALEKLWEYVKRMFDQSINFVKTMATSNKAFIEKHKATIEGMSAEEMAKVPAMTTYDYHPDIIQLDRAEGTIRAEATKIMSARVTKDNVSKVADLIDAIKKDGLLSEHGRVVIAQKMTNGVNASNWNDFKKSLVLKIQGEKKSFKFSKVFLEKIIDFAGKQSSLERILENVKKSFGEDIEAIKNEAKAMGSSDHDPHFKSTAISLLNVQRQILVLMVGTIVEMKNIKLNYLRRELGAARAFCMLALRHAGKKGDNMNESAIAFDPVFEATIDGELIGESSDVSSIFEAFQSGSNKSNSITF